MTNAPLVPPLVLFLAKHPMVDKYDLSSLKSLSSGAAPLARDLEVGVSKRLPNLESVRQGLYFFEREMFLQGVSRIINPNQFRLTMQKAIKVLALVSCFRVTHPRKPKRQRQVNLTKSTRV